MELSAQDRKTKALAEARVYYARNRERILERVKAYSQTERGKEVARRADLKRRTVKSEQTAKRLHDYYLAHKDKLVNSAADWKKGNPERNKYNNYRSRARLKNLAWEFSREEFMELIAQDCVYCGQEKPLGADRLDNSIGYTKNNTVPCCKNCNRMKLDHPLDDFLVTIKRIQSYLGL